MAEGKLDNQPDLKINSDGYFIKADESTDDLSWMGVDDQLKLSYMLQDISQSHHFTVKMSRIKVEFPTSEFGNFLPVKNMSYSEITFDNSV